jgi:hypothetical protein
LDRELPDRRATSQTAVATVRSLRRDLTAVATIGERVTELRMTLVALPEAHRERVLVAGVASNRLRAVAS